jgi:hypothetical protein
MKHVKKFESFGDFKRDLKSGHFLGGAKLLARDLKGILIDEPYKGGILKWELVNGEWTCQWKNSTFKIIKEKDRKDKRHKKWRLDITSNYSCHSSWYDSINSASRDAMTFYVPMLLKSRPEDEDDYPEEIDTNLYDGYEDDEDY